MEGKKILITGASGQFGRGLVHLLYRKNEVHALARFNRPQALAEIEKKAAKLWKVDMGVERPTMLPNDFDVVFHLAVAWEGNDTLKSQDESYHISCDFVGDLMYMNAKAAFVLGSTGSVYQKVVGLCKEDETPLAGGYAYVDSKIAMDRLARWICPTFDRKAVIMLYFWPYAPYQRHRKVDHFLDGDIAGDNPRAIHSRTNIKQLLDKTILAAGIASNPPLLLNCATDENLTQGDLARIGAKITGATLTERALAPGFDPEPGTNPDTTRLVKLLGPSTIKTEEGFRRYWKARRENINQPEDWMFEEPKQ